VVTKRYVQKNTKEKKAPRRGERKIGNTKRSVIKGVKKKKKEGETPKLIYKKNRERRKNGGGTKPTGLYRKDNEEEWGKHVPTIYKEKQGFNRIFGSGVE